MDGVDQCRALAGLPAGWNTHFTPDNKIGGSKGGHPLWPPEAIKLLGNFKIDLR